MTLTSGTACVQDQEFLLVERAIWFTGPDNCLLTGSEATPTLMAVDVAFETRIGMGFVVNNNQIPNVNSNTGIDDTEIKLETAEVSLSFTGGGVSPASFDVAIPTNSIPGGGTDNVVFALPYTVTESLRATMAGLPAGSVEILELEVVFKGRRNGQVAGSKLGEVEARPYSFPFEICLGCLTGCLAATECGGVAGDPDVCADPVNFSGVCGFAQGSVSYAPGCTAP